MASVTHLPWSVSATFSTASFLTILQLPTGLAQTCCRATLTAATDGAFEVEIASIGTSALAGWPRLGGLDLRPVCHDQISPMHGVHRDPSDPPCALLAQIESLELRTPVDDCSLFSVSHAPAQEDTLGSAGRVGRRTARGSTLLRSLHRSTSASAAARSNRVRTEARTRRSSHRSRRSSRDRDPRATAGQLDFAARTANEMRLVFALPGLFG